MKRYFTKILILFAVCLFTGISQLMAQATYYVATTGNNGNAGTDPSLPKLTIQAAIDAATANDVVVIAAGTYAEHLYIAKPITIKGNNAGTAATAWANPETIIRPATTNFTETAASALVEPTVSNITLDGIALYGDNNALSDATPIIINGVSARANHGVMVYNNINGQKVLNCKFANFVRRGVSWTIYDPMTIASGGNEIKNCTFDNMVRADGTGVAIYLNNYIAEVSNNTVTKADRGIFYETNASVAHTSPLLAINANSFSTYFRGVMMYGNGDAVIPATEIKNNTFTWQNISGRSGDGITTTSTNSSRGIVIERARGTSSILVQDNNITNYNDGIATLSVEKNTSDLNRMTIQGGAITNAGNVGVLISNYVNAWVSRAVIKGVQVINAANSGVFVTSDGNSYNTEAALSDGVVLQKDLPITTNYDQAIYVNGSKAILTELGNTKITNALYNLINLNNDAMQGLEVDGTAMIFDGQVNGYIFVNYTPGLSNDAAIAQALQERIRDSNPFSFGHTAPNAGLIRFNLGVLPVTLTEFNAKASNNGALLTWKTSSEKNNSHFVIARSNDGKNFTEIDNIKGNGTSDIEHAYAYTDRGFAKSAYYLLKQVDNDGKITAYTDKIRFVKGLDNSISIYPNPVVNELHIDLTATADVTIYSISGKKVVALSNQSAGKLTVNTNKLPAGNYVVVISDSLGTKQKKFIKK